MSDLIDECEWPGTAKRGPLTPGGVEGNCYPSDIEVVPVSLARELEARVKAAEGQARELAKAIEGAMYGPDNHASVEDHRGLDSALAAFRATEDGSHE